MEKKYPEYRWKDAGTDPGLRVIHKPIEKVNFIPVTFKNTENGLNLAGVVYTPRDFNPNKTYPALVLAGPMYSVKEQCQSNYAMEFARNGYVTIVYDNSTIGDSEGHPRVYENPEYKGSDARSAVQFLLTLPYVDKNKIGAVGICGSGSYLAVGLMNDDNVKVIASVVPFTIMDTVNTETDEQLLADKAAYEAGAEPNRLQMIPIGSEGAAYYYDPHRGASPDWYGCVSWSELLWHNFHPTELIKGMKKPYLVVTAENAFTLQGAEQMYENASSEIKEFYVVPNASHFEMYDGEPYVLETVGVIGQFLEKYLLGITSENFI